MFHHALNNYIYWKIGIFLLGLIIAAIIIYQKLKLIAIYSQTLLLH
jgi:hypothetical protein